MLRVLIAGILALLIGIAFCFAGYRFFRILIAIWGFLAILLAFLTLAFNLAKFFIIIVTALGGASTIITGVLLLLSVIPLDYLSLGVVGAIIRGSVLWSLIWLVLAIVGIIAQLSSTQQYAQGYAQSQF